MGSVQTSDGKNRWRLFAFSEVAGAGAVAAGHFGVADGVVDFGDGEVDFGDVVAAVGGGEKAFERFGQAAGAEIIDAEFIERTPFGRVDVSRVVETVDGGVAVAVGEERAGFAYVSGRAARVERYGLVVVGDGGVDVPAFARAVVAEGDIFGCERGKLPAVFVEKAVEAVDFGLQPVDKR